MKEKLSIYKKKMQIDKVKPDNYQKQYWKILSVVGSINLKL